MLAVRLNADPEGFPTVRKINDDRTSIERRSSRKETTPLALEMYSCLPREVRDRIYSFCVQGPIDNEVVVRYATESKHNIALLLRERAELQTYRWSEDPFASLLDVGALGSDTAMELLEAYYWTRTFKFDERHIGCLVGFLTADLFNLRMRPVDYIRSLQIQIRPLLCATMDNANAKQREQRKYCEALKALSVMQHTRPRISIVVDLAPGSIDDARYKRYIDDVDAFLFDILRAVVDLKAQGLRVELSYSTNWNDSRGITLQVDSVRSIGSCLAALKVACRTDQLNANF